MKTSSRKLRTGLTHLRVTLSANAYVGPGRADLLQGIEETHSIAAAGRRMGMSYKRAWGLVQALNNGFGQALVTTTRGGSAKGGAELTDAGREVLTLYRAMQATAADAISDELTALQKLVKTQANPE